MNSPKGRSLSTYIFCAVLSLPGALTFVLILVNLHREFMYFTVLSFWRMLFFCLFVISPLIAGSILFVLLKRIGKKTKAALFSLLVFFVFLSFVFTIAFSVAPPCGSFTDDEKNYLQFEESSPAYVLSSSSLFLKNIPENAENVDYVYQFYNYPDTRYDIFVSWSLPRDEYQKEKSRLFETYPNVTSEIFGDFDFFFICDEKKSTLDYMAFAFDDSSFTVRYVVSYIENVDINSLTPYYESKSW